jgi:hypothetical protein
VLGGGEEGGGESRRWMIAVIATTATRRNEMPGMKPPQCWGVFLIEKAYDADSIHQDASAITSRIFADKERKYS